MRIKEESPARRGGSGRGGVATTTADRPSRASVMSQTKALLWKNATEQRRNWGAHLLLLLSPLLFCGLMTGFQHLVNHAIVSSGMFKCGCECLECCYYLPGDDRSKDPPCRSVDDNTNYNMTNSGGGGRGGRGGAHVGSRAAGRRRCRVSDKCVRYNNDNCGVQYSSVHKAFYCAIPHPTVWPPLIQLPDGFTMNQLRLRQQQQRQTPSTSNSRSGGEENSSTAATTTTTSRSDASTTDGAFNDNAAADDEKEGGVMNGGGGGGDTTSLAVVYWGAEQEEADAIASNMFSQPAIASMLPGLLRPFIAPPQHAAADDPGYDDASGGAAVDNSNSDEAAAAVDLNSSSHRQSTIHHRRRALRQSRNRGGAVRSSASEEAEPDGGRDRGLDERHDDGDGGGDDGVALPREELLGMVSEEPMALVRAVREAGAGGSFALGTDAMALLTYYAEPTFLSGLAAAGVMGRQQSMGGVAGGRCNSSSSSFAAPPSQLHIISPSICPVVTSDAVAALRQWQSLPARAPNTTALVADVNAALADFLQASPSTMLTAPRHPRDSSAPDDDDENTTPPLPPINGQQLLARFDGLCLPTALDPATSHSDLLNRLSRQSNESGSLTTSTSSSTVVTDNSSRRSSSDVKESGVATTEAPVVLLGYDFTGSSVIEGDDGDDPRPSLHAAIWHNFSNFGSQAAGAELRRVAGPLGADGVTSLSSAVVNQRLAGAMSLATNGFVKAALGEGYGGVSLLGTREMPKRETAGIQLDFNLLTGPLFFTWALQLVVPGMLQQLVAERESRIRTMMQMHGLPVATYLAVHFVWEYLSFCRYLLVFTLAGHAAGLTIFTHNSITLQALFYLLFGAAQVAWTIMVSHLYGCSRTAVAAGNLWVVLSGAFAGLLMPYILSAQSSSARAVASLLNLLPPFGLYSGLFDLSQYSFVAAYTDTDGLTFADLGSRREGGSSILRPVLVGFAVEVPFFLGIAYFLGTDGISAMRQRLAARRHRHDTVPEMSSNGAEDVVAEEGKAKAFFEGRAPRCDAYGVVLYRLRKVYGGSVLGAPPTVACASLSLCLPHSECFGLLGPNGAGKTTAIHAMVGLARKSAGRASVAGLDVDGEMAEIQSVIGVCLQHDCLWDSLTAQEHLQFYCSLRRRKTGEEVVDAIAHALKAVDLSEHRHRRVGHFSGGMKRRLSLAIALVESPRVVYLDEPTTGIDPASRMIVWKAIREAKKHCTMILTTHSMDEAQALCDRLGIFVDGQLRCVGSSSSLRSRFGNHMVLTLVVEEAGQSGAASRQACEALVRGRLEGARLLFALSNTLKFQLPCGKVAISEVFKAVLELNTRVKVLDWGISMATLEEVFVSVASRAAEEGEAAAAVEDVGSSGSPLPVSSGSPDVCVE